MAKKRKNGAVSAEEFVRIWQRAKTATEVASKTGMTARSATVRASLLRARGVPLRKLYVELRHTLDIPALTKLAVAVKRHA